MFKVFLISNSGYSIISNVMPFETEDMIGKVDYNEIKNQFDIIFLKKIILNLVTKDKDA